MRPAKQNKLPVGHGPTAGSVRGPPMLDRLGEAIRQMLELMRRELDDYAVTTSSYAASSRTLRQFFATFGGGVD